MDNIKNDHYYIQKIRTDLEFKVLLDSMLFRMIQVSENARRLSDEYRQIHSTIP